MKSLFCFLVVLVSLAAVHGNMLDETGHHWSPCLGKCGKSVRVRTKRCALGTPSCDEQEISDWKFCQHDSACADVEVQDEDDGGVDTSCVAEFRNIGCFKTNHTHMHLIKKRSWELPKEDAVLSMWKRYKLTLEKFACECSKAARKGGYYYFSVGQAGYCWAGEVRHEMKVKMKKKNMMSNQCFMDVAQPNAVHGWHHEYFYFVVIDVDGGYSAWSKWSKCTAECGIGYKWRERSCTKPYPKGRGRGCDRLGDPAEITTCKVKECPVNGGFTKFTTWGKCTKKCGGGFQTRTRTCTKPTPAYGGKNCNGKLKETRPCNTMHCPVNGGLTKFTPYGTCSKLCGWGIQTRTRTCTNPTPAYGGKTCVGKLSEAKPCNTYHCPDIHKCSTQYTTWHYNGGGDMTYLSQHKMKCAIGRVLSGFHLETSGDMIRYAYTCCMLMVTPAQCQPKEMKSNYAFDGKGDTLFLNRHYAFCGSFGFITSYGVETDKTDAKVRYRYNCCELTPEKWRQRMDCYYDNTDYTTDGEGKNFYLTRQKVTCKKGYALSFFKLHRNFEYDSYRYRYKCCRVDYRK